MGTETLLSYPDGWHSLVDGHVEDYPTTGGGGGTDRVFGDPGVGKVYFGATNDHRAAREALAAGHHLGMLRTYWNNGDVTGGNSTGWTAAVAQATTDINIGRVPWLSFKLSSSAATRNVSWDQFAAGANDSWFAGQLLPALDAIGGGPIFLTLHAEPNGDEDDALNTGTVAGHKAMYSHAKTMTDDYPQILLTPVLSWNFFDITGGNVRYATWVAANGADVFGFNSYNHISFNPKTTLKNLTVAQSYGLQQAELNALNPNVPWAVSEWGNRTDPTHPGVAAQWIADVINFARLSNGIGFTWFDSGVNVNDGGSSWVLDDTAGGTTDGTERLNAFIAILNGPNSAFIPPGGIAP